MCKELEIMREVGKFKFEGISIIGIGKEKV